MTPPGDPVRSALVVVDVQNDFCPGGALAVPEGDAVVAGTNRLLRLFPIAVATQDWHPPGHGSFAASHPGRSPFETIELGGIPQVLWPVHCVQGTRGAAFHPGLDLSRIVRVFPKGTDPGMDSYSGFLDNDRSRSTGLEEWLGEQGVSEVAVCGLATDYCVRATALDAVRLGFRAAVIADACRGVGLRPGDIPEALEEMRRAGVEILDVAGLEAAGGLP